MSGDCVTRLELRLVLLRRWGLLGQQLRGLAARRTCASVHKRLVEIINAHAVLCLSADLVNVGRRTRRRRRSLSVSGLKNGGVNHRQHCGLVTDRPHGHLGFLGSRVVLADGNADDDVFAFRSAPLRAATCEDYPVHAAWQRLQPRRSGFHGLLIVWLFQLHVPLVHDVLVRRQVLRRKKRVEDHELHVQHKKWPIDEDHEDQHPQKRLLRHIPEDGDALQPVLERVPVEEVVDEEVQARAQDDTDHRRDGGDDHGEGTVVRRADAIVQPHAVVVENVNALVARPAMFAAGVDRHTAECTERHALAALSLQVHILESHVRIRRITIRSLYRGEHDHKNACRITDRDAHLGDVGVNQREAEYEEKEDIHAKDDPTQDLQWMEGAFEAMRSHRERLLHDPPPSANDDPTACVPPRPRY
mmetsp:Transcript_107583/g.302910  ORF Transcript_107583/g.302910 Transcript_107583/m.302910 type:complete len:416 (+) Transcript_107583:334-1581(+)